MSLYDEIINGTYKKGVTKINYKKKEDEDDYNSYNNLYDSIKSGTDYSVNNINTNVSSGIPDMSNNKLYKSIIDGTFGEQYAKSKNANKNVETKIEEKEPASFGKKAGWVAKKTGAGIAGGVTGIGQAAITDVANNIQQGKEKGLEGIKEDLKGTDKIQKERNELVKDSLDTTVKVSQIMNDKNTSKVEKVFNLFMYGIGQVMNKIGKAREDSAGGKLINAPVQALGTVLPESTTEDLMNINQNISKPIEEMNQRLAEEGQNYGIKTQWIGNAMQSVGNMTPSIAATLITKNPSVGLGIMGISAKGQSTEEALKKGASLNEAVKIGDEKAMVEIGTELLTGGVNIFGKGALDDILEKGIVDKVKNNVAKFFVQQGVNVLGETLEETIADIVDTAIDKGTIDPNATYSLKDWSDTAIETALSTFVLNLITGGMVNDVRNIKNNGTELKTVIDAEETKPLFVTKTAPDGNISFVESTQGIPIENSNNDLNINPAIVYNNKTDTYNVIDSNTGLLLDNSPYPSILSAKIGFNEKTTNISEAQVKKINDSVVKTELALIQKTNEIITELEENEKTNSYNNINIENNINNQQNTPTQINQDNAESNFYNEKTNYAVSNLNEIKNEFKAKEQYTLDEVDETWAKIEEDTYDLTDNDDYQLWLEKTPDNKIKATLYDTTTDNDMASEINSITIEPNKDGMFTAESINNAVEQLARIPDENAPIQGQIDIEGNQVQSVANNNQNMYNDNKKGDDVDGKRKRQIRNGNNEEDLEGNRKRENTRRKEENGRNNENSKREISRGLSNYVEQKKERLGRDFKAEIVKESDITERERIVSDGFKNVTGLNDNFYITNKSTTESAFYSANEIYQKHRLLVTKKILNHAPYHEFGHWLKDNMPKQWNKLHKIMDKTITKEQIENYISVLNDKEYYNKMKPKQKKEAVINEIISDYFGNWANDISNLKPLLDQGIISQEYAELVADITKEEKVVGYEIFGTLNQEKQMNDTITEIMTNIVKENNTEQVSEQVSEQVDDIPLFEDRNDLEEYSDLAKQKIEKFSKQISDWKNAKLKSNDNFELGNTPDSLIIENYNVKQLPIIMTQDVMVKATGGKHSISLSEISKIPGELEKPIIIIEGSVPNSFMILTNLEAKDSDNVFVAIHFNKKQNRLSVNRIASIYGKNNLNSYLEENIKNNKIIKFDSKKLKELITSRGLQLSKLVQSTLIDNSITDNNKNVKSKNTITNKDTQNEKKNTNKKIEYPRNVKEIQNLNEFLGKAIEQETNKYWKELLKDAQSANTTEIWTRRQSRLQWKRQIVQQYLDYKNGVEFSDRKDIDERKIQGLENYTISELKEAFKADVETILEENGIDDVNIIDIDLHGSRLRGTAKNNSDLDVVVQYDGNIREDDLFNILNEDPIEIEGIKIDFNPIQEDLKSYMERSNKYDQEILSTDSKGNKLTKAQQDFFKDSKVRDDNGKLSMVYHTTTDRVAQFNEFNPTTTKYYRFGDQVVNYFTDSQDMSGSYANSNYKVADTTKIENINQAKKWIDKYNNLKDRSIYNYTYDVEKADNGMLRLIQYERRANGENQRIGTYADLKYKDLIQYVQMLDHNFKNLQYQGYLNITNPYIVDAEGKNWNKVQSNIDKEILSELNEIKKDKDKVFKLKNLQKESLDKYLDYISGYKTFYEEDIKDTIKDIGRGQSNDLKEALEYCMMFGFNFDEYVESLSENYNINGNTKIKDIYDNYLKNHDVNDIKDYKTKMIHFADKTINNFLKKAHEYYTKDMMYGREYSYFKENYAKIIGKSFYDYSKENNITPENLYKIAKDFFSKDVILEVLGENETTNDIVKKVIEMNKNGSNYDGIIMKNVIDYGGIPSEIGRKPANLYVTFNSNQFKAKDNLNPTNDPDIRYSDRYDVDKDSNYGFYSQLEKVIEEKMPNTTNAQQLKGILDKAGIKQDEMKWIGLDDYLKAHSLEKLSKEKVMEYIKANQIYIETVQKGDSKVKELTEPIKEDIKYKKDAIKNILNKYNFDYEESEDDIYHYRRNGLATGIIGDFMADELEKQVNLDDFELNEEGKPFNEYTDANGVTKWVSVLSEDELKKDMQELSDLYEGLHEAQMNLSMIEDEYGDDADEIGIPKYKGYVMEGGTNYQEKLYTLPQDNFKPINTQLNGIDKYTSPHWNEKNVLAHTRTQDFEDINGNKVLFIDEIQSDLHQKGRKEGYRTKERTERIHDVEREIKELQNKHNDLEEKYYGVYHDIRDRMVDEMNKIQNKIIKDDDIFKKIESILSREEQQRYSTYLIDISYLLESQYSSKNFDVTDRKQLEKDIKNIMDTQTTFPNLPDSIVNKFENKNQFNKYTYDFIQSSLINDIKEDYKVGIHVLTENEINKFATEEEKQIIKERKKVREEFNENFDVLNAELNGLKYGENAGSVSDVFPFKKNWHEFALRRIINDAVSQGYDEVAWTTGRQQRERYNLSKAIDYIEYQRFYDHPNDVDKGKVGEVEISAYKDGNNVFDRQIRAEDLADYIGKDLAMRILNAKEGKGTISNLDEEIRENGNSGMYLFYDQEIPSYLNKYLKKWNSKVEPITIKDIDGKDESVQPGFKITKEMRESIKQNGQPLFSDRADIDDESKTPKREYTKEEKEYLEKQRKERLEVANQIRMNKQNADERANSYIEKEIKKIEATGDWDNSIPVTKMSDIRRTIEDYLGIGVQRGHFKQMAYGIYKADRDVLRTKNLKDMDNILHETGHALDLGKRLNIDKGKIASELLLAVERHGGYENESKQVKLDEGFAEILREYAIVPKEAKADYPQTVAVIEGIRNENKSFDKFINKVQQQIYNYIHQNPKNRVLSNISIGEQTDKPKWSKEWIKEEVMRNVYDKDYSLKLATNKLGKTRASENAYYLTRLASGIGDKITGMLSDGYVDDSGNKLFPGLNRIGEILGNDPKRFNDLRAYLVARRDSDYKAKTLKTGIRTMDSQAVINQFKNDKQIQEAAQLVYDTLDGVLQYAVNNHLVTQEMADNLRISNSFYVPMQRVLGLEGNNVGRKGAVSNIIKERTGSELDVKDVLENIIANSANVIQQVENNNILKALYKQGESIGLTGHVYDVIPAPMTKVGTATLNMWENELKKQGVNTKELDLEKTVDIFAPDNKIDTKNLITSFINDNGKRIYLQFNDDLIFNSLMNIDKKFMSQVLEINRKLNMPLRYGATMANLGFAIPNMISDTAQAAIYSTAGFIPVIDNAIGVLDILASTNKYAKEFLNKVAPNYAKKINLLYSLYQQTGATSATRLSQYRESTQNLMKEIYGTKNSETLGIKEKYKPLKRLLDLLTYIPEISEQSTRFRVFERNYSYYLRDTGSETDARIMAALESRDATQDFGRTGNLTREINQLIPFSAARVGSIYTFAEKLKGNPKKVAMRIAILTALAMAIKAMGYDDDEIDELIQRKKDDNFVIKVGDNVYTIKKPQGILRSIINLTEYIQDLFTGHIEEGKEGERLSTLLQNSVMDNMPSDSVTGFVPNMVAPLIENAINKDLYYKTDIVKSYDLDLPDSEQYYDYNSQLAILLGKIFNYSPAKIDNLISGYFAGLGTTITNVMDSIAGKTGLTVEKPEMGAEQDTIGKRFVVNVNSNSESLKEIYDRKTELTKKANGNTITEEENEELTKIKEAISNISKINKQIKEIKKDLKTNGKQKAEQIKELQKQRTDIAREALGKTILYEENEDKNSSIQFYPTNSTLSKNNYKLELDSDMKKQYEQIAADYYNKYAKQGLYSEDKLKELKSKAKEYAKNEMFKTYKDKIQKTK